MNTEKRNWCAQKLSMLAKKAELSSDFDPKHEFERLMHDFDEEFEFTFEREWLEDQFTTWVELELCDHMDQFVPDAVSKLLDICYEWNTELDRVLNARS